MLGEGAIFCSWQDRAPEGGHRSDYTNLLRMFERLHSPPQPLGHLQRTGTDETSTNSRGLRPGSQELRGHKVYSQEFTMCSRSRNWRNCLSSSISLATTTEYQHIYIHILKCIEIIEIIIPHTIIPSQATKVCDSDVCEITQTLCVPSWRLQICRWFILAGRNLEQKSAGIVRLKLMSHTIYDGRQGGWIIRPMPTPQVLQGNLLKANIILCKARSWRFSYNQEAPSCAV